MKHFPPTDNKGRPELVAAPAVFGVDVMAENVNCANPTVLQATISHDGRITLRGPRAAVVEFLACCARNGMLIDLDYLNWCG